MQDSLPRQNFKKNNINMSQPVALSRNKVQAEIKAKSFFCHDIVEKECEEVCRDALYSVVALIKANGRGTLSRKSLLCCNIQE